MVIWSIAGGRSTNNNRNCFAHPSHVYFLLSCEEGLSPGIFSLRLTTFLDFAKIFVISKTLQGKIPL